MLSVVIRMFFSYCVGASILLRTQFYMLFGPSAPLFVYNTQ